MATIKVETRERPFGRELTPDTIRQMFEATLVETVSFGEAYHTTTAAGQREMLEAFKWGVRASEMVWRNMERKAS